LIEKNKDQFGNAVASKRDVSEEELELAPYRIACPQHSQADEACSGSIKLGGRRLGWEKWRKWRNGGGCTEHRK
jgi:hypothetical protein